MPARELLSALIVTLIGQPASDLPRPELFDHGRIRNVRGISMTRDGRQLFVTLRGPDRNAARAFRDHVALVRYERGRWTRAVPLRPFASGTSERDPLVSPDGRRVYFSSTAPRPTETGEHSAYRVWYMERSDTGWSAPIYADSLNPRAESSVAALTADGSVYLVAGEVGTPASLDIYRSTPRAGGRGHSTPLRVEEWSTPVSEGWVSVDPAGEFAIVSRQPVADSSHLLLSVRRGNGWSPLEPLRFSGSNALRAYDYRYPFVAYDRSTLTVTSATRLFQLPAAPLLAAQGEVAVSRNLPAMTRLPVPAIEPNEPELFLPVDLRTSNGIAFTPDGNTVYLSQYTGRREGNRQWMRLVESRLVGGRWTPPTPVSFGEPPESAVSAEYHPALSRDGNTLYFNSRRLRASTDTNDLWRVTRTASAGWGTPTLVEEAMTPFYDDYASVTRDGSVYFRSDRPGGLGGGDIYVMRNVGGTLQPPVNVAELNSVDNENDQYVDPNERFIVFNRFFPASRELDLFISVKQADGSWATPRALTPVNTVVDYELTPTLSPDGRHLYVEVSGALLRWRLDALLTDEEKASIARR